MNKILTEIRQTRDDLARETGYDVQRLFDYIREREREAAARGVKFVSPRRAKRKPPMRCVKNRPSKNQNHQNENAQLPKRRRPGIPGH